MPRLAQISDCHLFANPAEAQFGVKPYDILCQVLEQVNKARPDGLLISGDITSDNSIESYASLHFALQAHCPDVPWRIIPGNHDNNAHFDTVFKDNWLTADQPWQLNGLGLVGLDTRYRDGNGIISTTQLLQIHTHLLQDDAAVWCLAMHHPPYALHGWMQKHECVNPGVFASWLSKQSNIACVLHGHLHTETAFSVSGVPVLGVPSTCWQFALQETFTLCDKKAGFRILDINNKEAMTTKVLRLK